MDKKHINLASLKKALASFEKAVVQPKNEFNRDSVIQRFEYTFELSWKALLRLLESDRPLDDQSVKGIIREAAKQGLIESVEEWFEFQRARNLSSHTYNEDTAEEVFELAIKFPRECHLLIKKIEKRINTNK